MTDVQPIVATPAVLAGLKRAPASFRLISRVGLLLPSGALDVTLPDGRLLRFEGDEPGAEAALDIRDWRFGRRLLLGGSLGFAESYIDGEWDSPDLPGLMAFFSANLDRIRIGLRGHPAVRAANTVLHALRPNTRAGAKRNIHAHYDLGNRFYELWLDATMTYSSALFDEPGQELAAAQRNKYRALADRLAIAEGDHVLEIGAGWGGFAEYAAKERGARVTAITISREQFDYARRRMQEQQLGEKVDIQLKDYRDVSGRYDRVASIEMFEAVGERFWPAYFAKIAAVLRPGGAAGLQIITIRDDLFEDYRRRVDFIQRYIFPGGMLPSVARLKEEVARAGLVWRDAVDFGRHYAETLAQWARSFTSRWDDIAGLGFDERFGRLWRYYLAYCEAGFRTGRIDVAHYTLAKA